MTTIGTARNILLNENENKINYEISCESDESENEIPYHAREHARPFTYGNVPKDFKRSDLNHVEIEELQDTTKSEVITTLPPSPSFQKRDFHQTCTEELQEPLKASKSIALLPASPLLIRKTGRPSISPSRPVLKKTPSREEFEEMLKERREQSMKDQNYALKEAQNASIQKDLDELQEKLNKRSLQLKQYITEESYEENTCREIVKLVETVDLPDEKDSNDYRKSLMPAETVEAMNKFENALKLAEPSRPETPAFPVAYNKTSFEDRCVSPYPMVTPGSPLLQRVQINAVNTKERRSPTKFSVLISNKKQAKATEKQISETPHDVAPHLVKFARDSSQYWYKPHLTREEAVALLRQAPPGTFIIRNSTTYKNAFGLVLRVSKLPQGVILPENSSCSDALVRHFLLEPTTRGVRLKGCTNEPTFTSLSALVYQHSINKLALPCKLIIPTRDLLLSPEDAELMETQKQLLEQGAACNVLYLFSMDMESLTGEEAIRRTVNEMYAQQTLPSPIEVHFKVSQNGITLTDNKRRMFFRRHYTPNNISYIAMDPDNRFYSVSIHGNGLGRTVNKSIFAFVARPSTGGRDNQCHIFCDLAVAQPALAIVSFAHKVLRFNNKNNHQML